MAKYFEAAGVAVFSGGLTGRVGKSTATLPPEGSGCVGFREDAGGTEEGAQCLVEILGENYRVAYPGENTFCRMDGYPYDIITP
jgi:hypothetical protein